MRVLLAPDDFSRRHPSGSELDLDALAEAYACPVPERNWLRANMVSSLDGAAQGVDGRSGTINTAADHVVFEVLRALSDIVVIGAGTARVEGYGALTLPEPYAALRLALGRPPELPLALVTESGNLPPGLTENPAGTAVYAITRAGSDAVARLRAQLGTEHVIVAGDLHVDLAEARTALHDRGFRHVHTEGGPTLLGALLDAGLVDELDLTLSPTVVGGTGIRIVDGPAVAAGFTPRVLVEQDGTLMGRWLRGRAEPS